MQTRVHSIQFKADSKLIDFIEARLSKLEQVYDRIVWAEVFLKLDKNKELGNKIVEIKVNASGRDLFAKSQAPKFEEATDSVIEALRRQIRRVKGKQALVH
jgi:putative sigma-54 modulation protein